MLDEYLTFKIIEVLTEAINLVKDDYSMHPDGPAQNQVPDWEETLKEFKKTVGVRDV